MQGAEILVRARRREREGEFVVGIERLRLEQLGCVDATVCGMSSSLIQVTVVPAFTVSCVRIEGEVVDLHLRRRLASAGAGRQRKRHGQRKQRSGERAALGLSRFVMIVCFRFSPAAACR